MVKAREETSFNVPFETSAVTVSAVDTFYRPEKEPLDPSIAALADSLSNIVPSLSRYSQAKDETLKSEAKDEATVAFRKNNMLGFKEAVKKGLIKEGANPYFIEAYIQQELIQKATQFKDQLYLDYKNEGIVNNTAPNAFEEFFTRKSNEFKESAKLDGYHDSDIALAFLPNVEAARAGLFERHVNSRIEIIETENRNLLANNTATAVENNIDASGTFDIEGLAEDLTRLSSDLVLKGMNGNDVNKIIIDTLTDQAISLEDDDILAVLASVDTGKGNLGDTAYAQEKIEQAENEILTKQIRKWNWENSKEDREQRKYREDTVQNTIEAINNAANVDVNKDGEINIVDGIATFDLEKYLRDEKITDPVVVQTLYSLTNTIISAQDNVIENKDYITDILIRMNTNIHDPDLMQKILDGMGTQYSVSRGLQIFNDYTRKRTNGDHYYLQGAGFKQLESSLRTAIKKDSLFTEDIAMAEVAVFELGDFATQWISNNPQGTKEEFNKAVRQEWTDILKVYVGNKNWSNVQEFENKLNENDNVTIDNSQENEEEVSPSSNKTEDDKNPFAPDNEKTFENVEEVENKNEERETLVSEIKSYQAELFSIDQQIKKIKASPKKNDVAKNALLAPLLDKKNTITANLQDAQKQLEGLK